MRNSTYARIATWTVIGLAAVMVVGALVGCGPSAAGGIKMSSAKQYLPTAQSRLSTVAPDSKLLLVQTANVVTTTATPVWSYLFGSPKTNTLYVVEVKDGQVSPAYPYGTVKFTAQEWKKVPNPDAWKVDSPDAFATASKTYTGAGSDKVVMGFVTYIPSTSTSTVNPFVWNVIFDPEGQGDVAARTVDVNATTGAVVTKK